MVEKRSLVLDAWREETYLDTKFEVDLRDEKHQNLLVIVLQRVLGYSHWLTFRLLSRFKRLHVSTVEDLLWYIQCNNNVTTMEVECLIADYGEKVYDD